MSNQEIFRYWAEGYTMVRTATAVGIDYLKTVVQRTGRSDLEFIRTWVMDFHSYLGKDKSTLIAGYLPQPDGHNLTIDTIEDAQERFWGRVGHKRGHFENEAKKLRRLLSR